MHLWHDPETLLHHLGEAGLWPERIEGPMLVLRRGRAPRYRLKPNLKVRSTKEGPVLLSEQPLIASPVNPRAAELMTLLEGGRSATELSEEADVPLADVVAFLDGLIKRRVVTPTA